MRKLFPHCYCHFFHYFFVTDKLKTVRHKSHDVVMCETMEEEGSLEDRENEHGQEVEENPINSYKINYQFLKSVCMMKVRYEKDMPQVEIEKNKTVYESCSKLIIKTLERLLYGVFIVKVEHIYIFYTLFHCPSGEHNFALHILRYASSKQAYFQGPVVIQVIENRTPPLLHLHMTGWPLLKSPKIS